MPRCAIVFLQLMLVMALVGDVAKPMTATVRTGKGVGLFRAVVLKVALLSVPVSCVMLGSKCPPCAIVCVSVLARLVTLVTQV